RAATRPLSSNTLAAPLPAHEARAALHRVLAVAVATAALLIVWRPAVVVSQTRPPAGVATQSGDSATVTHVVKAGESLWSIATRYYGNGAAWTELAHRNSISVANARPILVGMKLRVPATMPARSTRANAAKPPDLPAAAVAEAVAQKAPATNARATSLSAQTAGKADASPVEPRTARSRATVATVTPPAGARTASRPSGRAPAAASVRVVDTTPTVMSRRASMSAGAHPDSMMNRHSRFIIVVANDARSARGRDDSTIFLRRVPTLEEATASVRSATVMQTIAPRRGEYEAAPFTMAPERVLQGGRVGRRVGAAAVGSLEGAQRALIADEVEVIPPAGRTYAVGDRLMAVREVGKLLDGLSVIEPSGVLLVTQADAGKPAVAVVKSQSGVIEQGQPLHPVEGEAASPLRAVGGGDGLKSSVVWVDQESALPTLQSFLLLDAGTAQGVRAGDEFALMRVRGSANTGEEERIALVRVVRSGASGSTAIVIKQDRAEIAKGVIARRVARLP
ncbi:MAG: LysM peptidoglycan-binding domain-containing protein, partial [Gemmatimonas sp.]